MKSTPLTKTHQKVINALQQEHLTSFQLLKKVEEINLILGLYSIIDDLNKMGMIKSYIKEENKYHYIAA